MSILSSIWRDRTSALLSIGSALTVAGRLTVPGHGLTGWPGAYEAFAHIWVGVLLTRSTESLDWDSLLSLLRSMKTIRRQFAFRLLEIITVFETIAFFAGRFS